MLNCIVRPQKVILEDGNILLFVEFLIEFRTDEVFSLKFFLSFSIRSIEEKI